MRTDERLSLIELGDRVEWAVRTENTGPRWRREITILGRAARAAYLARQQDDWLLVKQRARRVEDIGDL